MTTGLAPPPTTRAGLLPLTRLILAGAIALTVGTGVGLFLAADRTADYWA